jgi:glutaredoxin-like protein
VAEVTVYWRPMCGYCESLKASLRRRGIPYTAVDIWEDRSKADVVKAANPQGHEIVPTVQVGDRYFVNPSVDEVVAALDA